MIKVIVLFYIFLAAWYNLSAQMQPLIPASAYHDEAGLLESALNLKPVILSGGYRQYDLVIARQPTWDDGLKDIIIRLLLPPQETTEVLPLVAYVHGGGYIGGSPLLDFTGRDSGFGHSLRILVDSGFAVASLGYRRAREAGWPAQVADLLSGLRFLSLHGHHWGIDASVTGIAGHSAGARLAVLLGLLDEHTFAYPDFPWQDGQVNIGAIWMWAGSAWDWPSVDQWVEFGKPRNYSVPRLLFGEHPATENEARFRFRLRASIPFMSMALPPLFMLRGASDYRGIHDDAKKTVKIWQALGAEATLSIVPGGHNVTGPVEPLVEFFGKHIKSPSATPTKKDRNPAETAKILNDLGEYMAAIETLVQSHSLHHGNTLPEGEWLILHDQSLLWSPTGLNWPSDDKSELERAKAGIADAEAEFALSNKGKSDGFRIKTAANNAVLLGADNSELYTLLDQINETLAQEKALLALLNRANQYWHEGRKRRARRLLANHADARVAEAYQWITSQTHDRKPPWADRHGFDVYGRWVSLSLQPSVEMRFRWVEPGHVKLPESMFFRNTTEDEWTTHLTVETGFWMAETETTLEQWNALAEESLELNNANPSADAPVSMIDYLQIIEWLNKLDDLFPDATFRLPTEEEWLFSVYDPEHLYPSVSIVAVHALSREDGSPGVLPVDHTLPDYRGYRGLTGGVMEWTASPGSNRAYNVPHASGQTMIIAYPITRGGAWSNMPHSLDLGFRMEQRHGNRQPDLGFRMIISEHDLHPNWLRQIGFPD